MRHRQQLVKDYQQLQALSRKMLGLASNGQWDELVDQEMVYIQLVEHLSKRSLPVDLDNVLQQPLRQILREVLENESQIKALLRKRMDDLSLLMKNSLTQQNVNSTYGEFAEHRLLPGELGNH
ncbi:flagella biosynthesis regulatory protein FliT [Pectobacterium cacticida]|uniref:flagella biosynthesis regulatory protein FliT n=1 Tax=Pectobacterium cacticida TaxID=69221 RepID=UPI00398854A5